MHLVPGLPLPASSSGTNPACPTVSAALAQLNTASHEHSDSLLLLQARLNGIKAVVLIDSGASENFVSQQFLSRHKLRLSEVSVLSVVLADGREHACDQALTRAQLRIGRYKDHVQLRSLPLQQCDIILGKPWLTRINPAIDWQANTLQFQHKGEAVFLSCNLDSDSTPTCSTLLSSQQLKRAVRKGSELFMAVVKPTDETPASSSEPSPLAAQLLSEFADVFPDQLPAGLPPSRDVDHAIETVPGAAPPSKAPYRMSPLELDELKKQLQELLDLGFIQPSKPSPAQPGGEPPLQVCMQSKSKQVPIWRSGTVCEKERRQSPHVR